MTKIKSWTRRKIKKARRFFWVAWWSFIIAPIARWLPLPIFKGEAIFLVHPRTVEDTYRWLFFLEPLGEKRVEWILKHLWPIIGPLITRNGKTVGRTFFCPWTVKMMLEDRSGAKEALQQSVKTARHLGAKWLAPGALAGSMTDLGLALKDNGMTITTGHSATTIIGSQILLNALERTNLNPCEATVAIVGGAGNIGKALTQQLAGKVEKIILVDRNNPKSIRRMKESIEKSTNERTDFSISTDTEHYEALQKADAVFTATSNPKPFLKAKWLKPGAIVVDDSQPVSMSRNEAHKHTGVVLQVVTHTPSTNANFQFQRGVGKHINYTCLAELLSLARNNTHEGVTGKLGSEDIEFISEQLKEAGYDQIVFRSFGRKIREEEWEQAEMARKNADTNTKAKLLQ